ncbi:MAG: hypothetical protein WD071_06925 [Pseudohongiella sp.]|uniref:hypothetical protein n=1 Tax=Pseudohongiella sp. TaxID=1979412 RepID=UPI0034A03A43
MDLQYIDYFDEIKGRSKAEQLDILAKARYEAFVVQRLVSRVIGYFVVLSLSVFVFTTAIKFYFDLGLLYGGLANALVFALGYFVHRRLYGKLLHKGLKSVLNAQNS